MLTLKSCSKGLNAKATIRVIHGLFESLKKLKNVETMRQRAGDRGSGRQLLRKLYIKKLGHKIICMLMLQI